MGYFQEYIFIAYWQQGILYRNYEQIILVKNKYSIDKLPYDFHNTENF